MTSRTNIHIVEKAKYEEWNRFDSGELFALCGTKVGVPPCTPRVECSWTEFPCATPPDTVCPACRDHPEYAMILLAGEEVYE